MSRSVEALAREVDSPFSAVIGTDLDGRIVWWNHAAEKLYGWSRDEVIGRNIVEVTPTEMSASQADDIMASLRSGVPWAGKFQVRGKDGRPFIAHVRDLPVRDDAGELVGIVGVSRASRP